MDFVDHNRVLVDGPLKLTGVGRQSIPIRWIVLTKLHVKIPFSCNQKCLLKALEAVCPFILFFSSFIELSRVSLCHFSAQPWFRFAHRFPFTAPQGKVMEQWKQTAWAKRLETRQKRAQMTDFERFKLRMAKRVVSFSSFFIFVLSFSSFVISFSLPFSFPFLISFFTAFAIPFAPDCALSHLPLFSQMNSAVRVKFAAIKRADRKQRMEKKAQKK